MMEIDEKMSKKSSQRGGWSHFEKEFFLERYNLYKDEVGKNRLFSVKKDMFNMIATEMASIGSTKTSGQVTSHFYSLTRKSKPKSIIDLSDATIIGANQALFIDMSLDTIEEQSTKEPLKLEITSDTSDFAVIESPNEISAINASSGIHIIETSTEGVNISTFADANASGGISKTSTVRQFSPVQMTETLPADRYVMPISTTVNPISKAQAAKPTSIGILSAHRSNVSCSSQLGAPFSIQKPMNVGIATIYNRNRAINVISTSNNGTFSTEDFNRPVMRIEGAETAGFGSTSSYSQSCNPPALSRAASFSFRNSSSEDVWTDDENKWLFDQYSYYKDDVGPMKIFGNINALMERLAKVMTDVFGKARTVEQVTEKVQTISNLKKDTTSLSLKNSKKNDDWTDDETKWLLDQYGSYMNDVGPLKLFRNKNALWEQLAKVMTEAFGKKRSAEQLSKRVQHIIKLKKTAVERNGKSGASRVNVAYEAEISRIAAMDDSIEPEVLRDANSVYYKQKNIGEQKHTKPRWDKPNKKGICDNITNTMSSMEQRRLENDRLKEERMKMKEEREKEKDENRKKLQEGLLEALRSISRRET